MKIAFAVDDNKPQICLFGFKSEGYEGLKAALQDQLVEGRGVLWLNSLEWLEGYNCSLSLRISEEDLGIIYAGKGIYWCDLRWETYQSWVQVMNDLTEPGAFGWLWLDPANFSLRLVR